MKKTTLITLAVLLSSLLPVSYASDLEPSASITASPSRGTINTVFTFDASDSVDQRGFNSTLEYRWNFHMGGSEWTDWGDDSVVTHQYDSDGIYQIKVEVRDEDGRTDYVWTEVTVDEELHFETEFTVTPEEGDTDTTFEFDIDTTTNINYNLDDFEYRWDFDGDGTWDTDYTSADTMEHIYPLDGTYMPILEVKSPDGTTMTINGFEDDGELSGGDLYVYSTDYPNASIKSYPSSGDEDTTFYFSAEDSWDGRDHNDIEFRWDFEGDGVFDVDWTSEETTSHKYGVYGEYEVILQVRDTEGYTDETRFTITIASEGFAPEAKFTISSDYGLADSDVGTTSTEFTFSATSSSDSEDYSSELEVRWDFDGDGDFDTDWDSSKFAYHQFLETGEYEVTLEVRDTDGNVSEATYDIRIINNTEPTASFTVSPTEATPGVDFDFDAGNSSDDQYKSYTLEVRWDFDGDGTWDTDFSTDKTVSHNYDSPGSYDVILQVKDPESNTSEASQTVTVLTNTSPYAGFSIDQSNGTYSTKFTFDASASEDGQTDFDDLWFRWDFDYNGVNDITYDTSWRHSETTTHYFDEDEGTGDITIRLEVKDADGEVSTATETIWIHWASPYLEDLRSQGVIRGYSGDMRPDQNITRAELLKIVLEAQNENMYGMTYQGLFSDVSSSDWHWKYVEKAHDLGIINGYDDGTFKPNQEINRAEALKIIVEGFGISGDGHYDSGAFSDISTYDWFYAYVMTAYEDGIVNGYSDGTFGPGQNMTRGEASKVVSLAAN